MTSALVPSGIYLDGAWTPGGAGALPTLNPATGEVLAEIRAADAADVDRAVAAANRAQHGDWAAVPPSRKGTLMAALADLVERDTMELARLEALEVGVPLGVGAGMFVPSLIASLRHFSGWADKINGEVLTTDGYFGRSTLSYTRREPVGVIAAIVPWNAPLMLLGWKLALAAGNAVIVKPAEDASLGILHLARLVEEAGFPAGTVQVLPGAGEWDRAGDERAWCAVSVGCGSGTEPASQRFRLERAVGGGDLGQSSLRGTSGVESAT